MLSMKTYTRDYIDACRSRVEAQVSSYGNLVEAARNQIWSDETALDSAFESFESVFFNNLVLVPDSYFTHRLRGIEGKDRNPLNEVRVLCNSMRHDNETMCTDNTIKMNSAKSVLKYRVGDKIRLNEHDFLLISRAFLAEIESKYAI